MRETLSITVFPDRKACARRRKRRKERRGGTKCREVRVERRVVESVKVESRIESWRGESQEARERIVEEVDQELFQTRVV